MFASIIKTPHTLQHIMFSIRDSRNVTRRACPDFNSSAKHNAKSTFAGNSARGLQHIRKVLVNERRRLETRRLETFKELDDAVRKLANDEINFVRLISTLTKEGCDKDLGNDDPTVAESSESTKPTDSTDPSAHND